MATNLIFLLITPLTFLLFFHCSATITVNDEAIIQAMCSHTQYPIICITSLDSDRRSYAADFHGLARISMELALLNGSRILSFVSELQKTATDPDMKNSLAYCSQLYNTLVFSMFKTAIEKFDAGDYADAVNMLLGCVNTAEGCEQIFKAGTSPLTQKNAVQLQLCDVSMGLIQELYG
ncbi:putative invertase inhibitor [Tasmannia lanceolata]|uniref:putative invertase inhibitor n=1 Tax=Tasmannia lanceolata TaxID=3420 RepID=UPI0040642636